jgi:hypothetical protein
VIKKGSWVKYTCDHPSHLEGIGIVKQITHHQDKWRGNPWVKVIIVCQTIAPVAGGGYWSLNENFSCGLHLLQEITKAEAVLFILKNGGKSR